MFTYNKDALVSMQTPNYRLSTSFNTQCDEDLSGKNIFLSIVIVMSRLAPTVQIKYRVRTYSSYTTCFMLQNNAKNELLERDNLYLLVFREYLRIFHLLDYKFSRLGTFGIFATLRVNQL